MKRLILLTMLVIMMSTISANATIMTQNASYQALDFSKQILFDQFDTSLGTLNGVSLLVHNEVTFDYMIYAGVNNIYTYYIDSDIQLILPGLQTIDAKMFRHPVKFVADGMQLTHIHDVETADSGFPMITSQWFLDYFIGTGDVVCNMSTKRLVPAINALYVESGGITDITDITLKYDYTESTHQTAPVPEPSTMLLLGGGLAGLAFWRRKKTV